MKIIGVTATVNGQVQKWVRHGKGQQVWPDGSKYDGDWFEDKMEGKGKLIRSDNNVYEGDFKNDKAEGTGKYIEKGGETYIG